MKGMNTSLLLALLLVAAGSMKPLPASGQGTIVSGSINFSQVAGAPPGDASYLVANAYPGGPGGGFFALSLTTIATGQYQLGYYGIAELYSVHAANSGMAFTPAYVAGDTPLLNNNNTPGTYQFSLGLGQSMLFAYWDDAHYIFSQPPPGALPSAPDVYDSYGWFRLTRQISGLVITDSATALGGGIIVGTYNAVPEPTSFALGLLAAFGIALRRRR
jgi:MYXO-CTERM domain-containing protein